MIRILTFFILSFSTFASDLYNDNCEAMLSGNDAYVTRLNAIKKLIKKNDDYINYDALTAIKANREFTVDDVNEALYFYGHRYYTEIKKSQKRIKHHINMIPVYVNLVSEKLSSDQLDAVFKHLEGTYGPKGGGASVPDSVRKSERLNSGGHVWKNMHDFLKTKSNETPYASFWKYKQATLPDPYDEGDNYFEEFFKYFNKVSFELEVLNNGVEIAILPEIFIKKASVFRGLDGDGRFDLLKGVKTIFPKDMDNSEIKIAIEHVLKMPIVVDDSGNSLVFSGSYERSNDDVIWLSAVVTKDGKNLKTAYPLSNQFGQIDSHRGYIETGEVELLKRLYEIDTPNENSKSLPYEMIADIVINNPTERTIVQEMSLYKNLNYEFLEDLHDYFIASNNFINTRDVFFYYRLLIWKITNVEEKIELGALLKWFYEGYKYVYDRPDLASYFLPLYANIIARFNDLYGNNLKPADLYSIEKKYLNIIDNITELTRKGFMSQLNHFIKDGPTDYSYLVLSVVFLEPFSITTKVRSRDIKRYKKKLNSILNRLKKAKPNHYVTKLIETNIETALSKFQ